MSKDLMMVYPSRNLIDPLDPDPEQIELGDIANSLAMRCRYGGHVPRFYSVAEHCVLMAHETFRVEKSKMLAFAALMHDAAEYIIGDMIRPMKQRMPIFRAVDDRLSAAIFKKFEVAMDSPIVADEVADYDFRMLRTEMDSMLGAEFVGKHFPHIHQAQVLPGVKLQHWNPWRGCLEFVTAFHAYRPSA